MKLSKLAELLTTHLGDDPIVEVMSFDGQDDVVVAINGLRWEVGVEGKITKLVLLT